MYQPLTVTLHSNCPPKRSQYSRGTEKKGRHKERLKALGGGGIERRKEERVEEVERRSALRDNPLESDSKSSERGNEPPPRKKEKQRKQERFLTGMPVMVVSVKVVTSM